VTILDLATKRGDVASCVEPVQDEIAPGCREALRSGEAEAAYGSGDEGGFFLERTHAGRRWLVVW
jgi:hypothetical protein